MGNHGTSGARAKCPQRIAPALRSDIHSDKVRMTRSPRTVSFWAVAALLLSLAPTVSATIRYTISLDHPEQHVFHVRMEVPNARNGMDVAIPAWNALYQIRDFAYRIRNVRVSGNAPAGVPLAMRKLDKQTWEIDASSSTNAATLPSANSTTAAANVVVEYSIEWDDPGPFNSQLDRTTHSSILRKF